MHSLSQTDTNTSQLPAALADDVSDLSSASLSKATRRAYRGHCRSFARWCSQLGLPSYPTTPEIVAGWITHLVQQGKRPSTISQSVSAISAVHTLKGGPNLRHTSQVKRALSGAARTLGVAPQKKEAATASILMQMIASITGNSLKAKRDRALLALGFSGALRRSELVALQVEDVQSVPGGALVTIRRSKTDQTGEGQTIGIPIGVSIRPLEHLSAWLKASEVTEGLIFRRLNRHGHLLGPLSGSAVAEIVKSAAQNVGLDPRDFAGHSLRAGFITSGAEAGKDVLRIAEVSRHKNLEVLRGYVRRANLLRDHAGASFL